MFDLMAWKQESGVDYIVVDVTGRRVNDDLWFLALESGCFLAEYDRLLEATILYEANVS